MPIESATYISQLNAANPTSSDPKAEGDNHLRLVKSALLNTLPNWTATPILASSTEVNHLVGVTAAIQTQIDAKAPLASPALTGTPTVPTAANGTSTTQAASTAFVQAAIASVNAQTATALSIVTATSVTATAGQHIVLTNASTSTCTLPASPAAGDTVWVTVGNGRTDSVIARNGQNIMSLAEDLTVDNANVTVQLRYVNSSLGWRLV